MFSARTGWDRATNALTLAKELAQSDPAFVDMTESNPTAVGFPGDRSLLDALARPNNLSYRPEPFGARQARIAVADYYRRRKVDVDPDRVILTSGTSEAYTFLFRLLLDPGAAVAVPAPSYPLLSFLAGLADVELLPYELVPKPKRWCLDVSTLMDSKAIVCVQPNNPTGSTFAFGERSELTAHARRNEAAVISDEVFLDYLIDDTRFSETTFAMESRALTFTLSGLSKVAGLPQMKLSWIVVSGPDDLVTEALHRLEIVADTFLSVSTPVQNAAAAFFEYGRTQFRPALRARLSRNRAMLPEDALPSEGGWYAVLPLYDGTDDERFVLDLLERERVLVHPGFFCDMDDPALILSLLLPEEKFARGLARIVR